VFIVTALDRDTGKKVWEHAVAAEGELPELHEKHNLASPSPVTDGQRVYAWFGTGQILALDLGGKVVWQRHLAREVAPVTILWGPGSSPTVYGDTLYLLNYHGESAYLLAADARTGKTKWKVDGPAGVTSYSTPVLVKGPNGPELIVNSSVGVAGHDPTTGKQLWNYEEANSFPIPAAVPHGQTVYLNRGYRSSPFMAIKLGGRGDIAKTHVAWRQPSAGPYVPSIIHYEGLIYMATDQGIVSAYDANTGDRVWQERLPGVYMASPVAGDGKVYFVGETGETLVLEAGRQLKILARNKLTGRFGGSPAISGGRIFLRADDRLVAVGDMPRM
jgi:outer membrane protein assembly factor BamB